jgi:voltage-gated potassium channel
MDTSNRQLRLALATILILIPVGTIGMMALNQSPFGEALYFTIVTLATVGYGDVVPRTDEARAFVAVLIPFGLSAFAFALQAIYYSVFANPALVEIRQKRVLRRAIKRMRNHFIVAGTGELAYRTIDFLQHGEPAPGRWLTGWSRLNLYAALRGNKRSNERLLDQVIVITSDAAFAQKLRSLSILVVLGNAADEDTLRQCGIDHAQALLVMSEDDTETLLTVLTARAMNRTLLITATILDDSLSQNMVRVGANQIVAPYAAAGSFLNNATLRPAVNGFFYSIAFDPQDQHVFVQLRVGAGSEWIGKTPAELELGTTYHLYVLGLRRADGTFHYTRPDKCELQEDDTLIAVGQARRANQLVRLSEGYRHDSILWQVLPPAQPPLHTSQPHTLEECRQIVQTMNKHFIICGTGPVAQRALRSLNPARPFVVVSDDLEALETLRARGFRVIAGKPTNHNVLLAAGVKRAQAIMVTPEDTALAVLTILTARSLNKHLLITATAYEDAVVAKLERAGADRVVSPFSVAARFLLLATTSPHINDFIQHVMFNYQTGLETTELYMEDDSPWIGHTLESLRLDEQFDAGVIGIRQANRRDFIYAPPPNLVIQKQQVLIVITPMQYADLLRELAHGHESKRPSTLRTRVMQSSKWTREELQKLLTGENHSD